MQALAPQAAPYPFIPQPEPIYHNLEFTPVTQSLEAMTMRSQDQNPSPSNFDFDKMMADYFSHQFPSAMCQHCGMNGCTCRNCPAVMQSFESGSWAQCCSRKHVRTTTVVPGPMQHFSTSEPAEDAHALGIQHGNDPTFTQDMQVDEMKMMDGSQPMDLSDLLMNDLEGCCCRD
jgi:hypothetical protein